VLDAFRFTTATCAEGSPFPRSAKVNPQVDLFDGSADDPDSNFLGWHMENIKSLPRFSRGRSLPFSSQHRKTSAIYKNV
jgi:hypothetical protein